MVQCLPTLKSNILAQLSPSLFVLFLDPLNSFSIFRRTIIAFQCKYFVLIFHGPTVRKMFTLSHSVPTDVFWNKWCLSQGCSIQTRKLLPLMLQIKTDLEGVLNLFPYDPPHHTLFILCRMTGVDNEYSWKVLKQARAELCQTQGNLISGLN